MTHRFEIVEPPTDIDLIIGRDLAPLGIGITGLPLPASESPVAAPEDKLSQLAQDESPSIHPLARHTSLAKAIARNQSIPANYFAAILTQQCSSILAKRIQCADASMASLTLLSLSLTLKSKHGWKTAKLPTHPEAFNGTSPCWLFPIT